ncbi:hypothetical protein [Streptomyces sp. 35G-GA-8]|uniref:hypothetical protein n=1 Tax=Streptomyces sp. 35G-GA-8 TaxID=2939434 RepID=UPI00201F1773|nr:hypothetical protein [Streptomyces sp. 35G-GA-8]MCL7382195.1 hypothetical protein [Streptomyces sp. 35G-GA-8]
MALRSRAKKIDTRTEEEQQASKKAWVTYGGPWAITVGGCVVAETGHVLLSATPASLALAALGLAGTGAALTKLISHIDVKAKRDKDVRIRHQVNSIATTAGVTLGTVVGLETGATAGSWLLAGAGLSIGNNIWSALYKKSAGEKSGGKWSVLEKEIGLAKHELKEAQSNGKGTVVAKVEAKDGATADEFARRIPAMASALKLGAGRITHTVDDDDSSDITMRVQVADLLKEGFPWPGPSAFGTGFGDSPLHLGRYEDGETLKVNLPGVLRDPQGLKTGNVEHCIFQGTNGSGKTQGNASLITDAATRSEVSIIIVNCAKFMQDYGHIRHAAEMVITNEKEAKRFFKQLGPVINARASYLASKGLARWEPGCGINFLMIVCGEAADYADGDAYGKVLRTIRSSGGWVESEIQRATHDQMDTSARANHPAGVAFGLADGAEAQYVLPPEAIEAGAFPGWGNRKPGYSYWAGMGIPEERWAVVARTYSVDRPTLAAAVTAGMNVRTPMDATTAEAFGPLWTNRTFYTTPLLEGGEDGGFPQRSPAAPSTGAGGTDPASAYDDSEYEEDEDVEIDEELLAKETEDMMEEIQSILDSDPEPGVTQHLTVEAEIEAPADDAPTFQLPSPAADDDKLSQDACRQAILQRLHEWFANGKSSFEPKEVSDLWLRVSLKTPRNWWNRLRTELLESGVIEDSETYGEYDIVRDPLTENN